MKFWILAGGNMGDTRQILKDALVKMEELAVELVYSSSLYESEPWGFDSNQHFINQLFVFESDLLPDHFMHSLLKIENDLGRKRENNGYSARTIDLDIIFIGNLVYSSNVLDVPHARMHIRKFALLPCVEYKADFRHPIYKKTLEELLYSCEDSSSVAKL